MDGQSAFNYGFTIVLFLIGALGGAYLLYFSDTKNAITERLTAHDEKFVALDGQLDDVNRELGKFRVEVQKNFVSQEDHVRITQGLDAKLDRLLSEIHKVDKNVTRIAAAQGVELE